jgi:hypothetical protein
MEQSLGVLHVSPVNAEGQEQEDLLGSSIHVPPLEQDEAVQ